MASKPDRANYILASDEEIARLSNQHEVIKDAMSALLLVPIDLSDKSLRILDSATADGMVLLPLSYRIDPTGLIVPGTWIVDLKSTCPYTPLHSFVGVDIDASNFPRDPPAGVTYQIQDINKPWPKDWLNSFDVVHQRLALVAAGPGAQTAVKNLSELIKPGGWIQLIEADNVLTDADGLAMQGFVRLMKDIFTHIGTTLRLSKELSGWVKENGFLNVQERVVNVQLGATNPNPQLAKRGVYSTVVAATGLVAFGKSRLIHVSYST